MIRPLEKGRKSPAKNNVQQYNKNQIVNSPIGLHVGNGHDWQEMRKNFISTVHLFFSHSENFHGILSGKMREYRRIAPKNDLCIINMRYIRSWHMIIVASPAVPDV